MAYSAAADRVRAHYARFTGDGRQSLVVPEWGEDDSPLVIYWDPFTLADHIRIFGPDKPSDVGAFAEVVHRKAQTRDGKPLFVEEEDKFILRRMADASVVKRIADAIMTSPTVEEHAQRLRDDALRMAMHALADRLQKTIGEIEAMPVSEFRETLAFHTVRKERERR